MLTLTNETTLGGVPLENSKKIFSVKEDKLPSLTKKIFSVKEDKLPSLTDDKIEEIQKSLKCDTILLPLNLKSYSIFRNEEGYLEAYINFLDHNGNIVQIYDPNVIIKSYGRNTFGLFREFSKEEIAHRIYYYILGKKILRPGKITGMLLEMDISELSILMKDETVLNSKIEEAIQVLKEDESSNLNESEEKNFNLLSSKYSIQLSEEEIRKITGLLVKIALFKKSIILSNGNENSDYFEIFNRILEYVRSKIFIPNRNQSKIRNFLNFIINRVIPDPSLVYRGSEGRPTEDLKSILHSSNIEIPVHPRINGKILSLKDKRFPFRYYEEELINVIMNSLNDDSKLTSIGLLVSLWDQTDGLQVFVDEVSQM